MPRNNIILGGSNIQLGPSTNIVMGSQHKNRKLGRRRYNLNQENPEVTSESAPPVPTPDYLVESNTVPSINGIFLQAPQNFR